MEKQWITVSAPSSGRAVVTIAGSVVLHLSIIAVAALWPVHAVVLSSGAQITEISAGPPEGLILPTQDEPNSVLTAPPPLEPPSVPVDSAADTLPPSLEELNMIVEPPKPLPTRIRSARSTSVSVVSNHSAPRSVVLGGLRAGIPGIAGAGRPRAGLGWKTPQPPYPAAARAGHISGSGSVRITTDGTGRVVSAVVVRSIGNALLDAATISYARTLWTGPPNLSIIVPITYQLR